MKFFHMLVLAMGAAAGSTGVAFAQTASPSLTEKMNAYVECLNRLSERAYDSRSRYFSWAGRNGPTGKEPIIYGTYTIYDTADCKTNVEKANALDPREPELERAASAYVEAVVALEPLLKEADDYYEQEDYKDDKMAKGKALHPRLVAAWTAFASADEKMRANIDAIQDKLATEKLAEIESTEGRKEHYHIQALMMRAKRVMRAQSSQPPNLAKITETLADYEAIAKATETYAAANPGSKIGSSFVGDAKTFLVTAKQLMRRLRDKVPYSSGEKMMLDTDGGGWMVEGSPGRLLRDYNQLVESYNRGPDFGSSAPETGGPTTIVGKWDSNKGPMTITQEATGSYSVSLELEAGKITGSLEDTVFQGTWVRNEAPERCKSEKDGSPYWGGFKVTFYTPEVFQGSWYWCTHELESGMTVENWTGARPK